ncbi:hypothetical protein ABIB37_002235 [Agrococcus sp. UYP10]|uniref:hypothetical protein n=1 Tax=Agrococcus sp. UYP10 TaxID=1756355 RepID=UPI003393C78D
MDQVDETAAADEAVSVDAGVSVDGAEEEDRPTIAGHPLVRLLRRTAEREVWVAADASGAGVELQRSMPGEEALLAREVEALLLADHAHLEPILDVATDAGVVVVRPLLPRDLADWLRDRGAPDPGEAVTALAPIAAALGALHAVGATAGAVSAHHVRLDADGAPLLTGEGARVEAAKPSIAWREGSAGVAADADAWRSLAEAVLAGCGEALPDAVERAIAARDLAAAGAALLEAWPALPLALQPDVGAAVATTQRRRRIRAEGLEAVWARAAVLLERVAGRMRWPGGGVVGRSLAAVRPRFWAVAVGGVAAVALALLLPAPGAADEGSRAAERSDASARPTASSPVSPRPQAQPHEPAMTDDPVAGAALLLAEREACLAVGDAACLVGLHEPDSPQLTAASPWRMPDDGRLELVQRLGDAWLLRVVSERAPASVLVMSTEAGWTLRDAWSAP